MDIADLTESVQLMSETAPTTVIPVESKPLHLDTVVDAVATDNSMPWIINTLTHQNHRFEQEQFANMKTGINFSKYDDVEVKIHGNHRTEPINSYQMLPLPPFLRNNILLAKYDTPTPIQKWSLPLALNKLDIMACAQTGSGKTVAFLLPLLHQLSSGVMITKRSLTAPPPQQRNHHHHNRYNNNNNYRNQYQQQTMLKPPYCPSALILAPTRELAIQIHTESVKFSYRSPLKSLAIYGGKHQQQHMSQLQLGVDILIATPGRLIDYLKQQLVSLSYVQYLVCDEADRMLDMGFEPQLREIVFNFDMPPDTSRVLPTPISTEESPAIVVPVKSRQTLMFSATFPSAIQRLASAFLSKDYVFITIGRVGDTSDLIEQTILEVDSKAKNNHLSELLPTLTGRVVIFVERKKTANYLENFLLQSKFNVVAIHGGRSQKQREDALYMFKAGRVSMLLATDVAARGLDIPDVQYVINYDMPTSIDSYVHRIGRTGRCGHTGHSIAYVNDETLPQVVTDLVELLEKKSETIPEFLQVMYAKHSHTGHNNNNGSYYRYNNNYNGGFKKNFNNNNNYRYNNNNNNRYQNNNGNKFNTYNNNNNNNNNNNTGMFYNNQYQGNTYHTNHTNTSNMSSQHYGMQKQYQNQHQFNNIPHNNYKHQYDNHQMNHFQQQP